MPHNPDDSFGHMDLETIEYKSSYCDSGGYEQTDEVIQQRKMVSALMHGDCEPLEYLRYLENNPDAMLLLADETVARKLLGKLLRYFHLELLRLKEATPEEERQRKMAH